MIVLICIDLMLLDEFLSRLYLLDRDLFLVQETFLIDPDLCDLSLVVTFEKPCDNVRRCPFSMRHIMKLALPVPPL